MRSAGDERIVPLTIASGAEVSHYFDMKLAEPAVVIGRVSVVTDPPGARVSVDGKARGTSPITVTDSDWRTTRSPSPATPPRRNALLQ